MNHRITIIVTCLGMIAGALLSQTESQADEAKSNDTAGWVNLLEDGKLTHWKLGNGKPVTQGWIIEKDGTLYRASRGGSIYTQKEYGDFILEFEWKVAKASNSGVKYRVTKYGKSLLGPEYQVLDDVNHPDAKKGTPGSRTAAALYDILACNKDKKLKPVGEFNKARIVAKGTKFEHWLNGKKVIDIDTASDEFKKAVMNSKFKNTKDFAKNPKGLIMLQDHSDPVWFKNIRIKALN